jgi:DNA repair protein RadC
MRTTVAPRLRAARAAPSPADPPPRTTTSASDAWGFSGCWARELVRSPAGTSVFTRRRRVVRHPDAVPDAQMNLPRRIDGPASAVQLTRDLLRHRREDITLALYLDDRHRLVGTAILAVGWVQAARLSARPILSGSQACRATGFVLVRSRRSGAPSATGPEDRTFRTIAAACSRYGLVAVDHLVVTCGGSFSSAFVAQRGGV